MYVFHNDYPLVPEKVAIPYDMLSNYCKNIADKYGIKVGDVKKLINYRNLQLYLSLGMRLTKIHKVLKFKQCHRMKNILTLKLKKRTTLLIVWKKIFFKLIINSVYGKTMDNLRKRINVRPVKKEIDFLKYTRRPTHITHKIFDENYAAIHEIKQVLTLNKPIYFRFTVLELSKWLMYDFHFNCIKKDFHAELLFTDVDSLTYTHTNKKEFS